MVAVDSYKRCRDCSEWRLLEDSGPSTKNRDGAVSYCPECLRTRHALYREVRRGGPSTVRVNELPGLKWCPGCRRDLPREKFGANRSRSDGQTTYCRPCQNAKSRASLKRAGGSRAYYLPRRYGITVAQYDEMFERQGGLCDLCHERKAEHVDHCHATKTVRALLCFCCNQGLGNFRDEETTLLAAAEYVVRHRGGEAQPTPVDPVVAARFRAMFGTAA